jgi:hypothetical protein
MLKALLINLGIFSGLFVLHILFAANGMDMAFTAVALLISFQIIGFGPLTVALTRNTNVVRRQTLRRSFPVALPLAFGLAWAYGDMAWSLLETTGVVGASLVVHLAFDRYWREEA